MNTKIYKSEKNNSYKQIKHNNKKGPQSVPAPHGLKIIRPKQLIL